MRSSACRRHAWVRRPEQLRGAPFLILPRRIRNTIEALAALTVIRRCATGTTAFCPLIHRGPNGSLWENIQTEYVTTTEQNIGKLRTKGRTSMSSNGCVWDG